MFKPITSQVNFVFDNRKMADGGRRVKRPQNLALDPSQSNETPEASSDNEVPFSPDSARRQRVFSESSKIATAMGQVITHKKHDVFQTLQETLGVLKDEAVVSRDSHKKEGLWCHPFEIPRHPIEQIALRNEEIALERQHSKMIESLTPDDLNEFEEVIKKEKEDPADQKEHEHCPFYQKVSISGGDISGVCTIGFSTTVLYPTKMDNSQLIRLVSLARKSTSLVSQAKKTVKLEPHTRRVRLFILEHKGLMVNIFAL